jgi:hypothetical protein
MQQIMQKVEEAVRPAPQQAAAGSASAPQPTRVTHQQTRPALAGEGGTKEKSTPTAQQTESTPARKVEAWGKVTLESLARPVVPRLVPTHQQTRPALAGEGGTKEKSTPTAQQARQRPAWEKSSAIWGEKLFGKSLLDNLKDNFNLEFIDIRLQGIKRHVTDIRGHYAHEKWNLRRELEEGLERPKSEKTSEGTYRRTTNATPAHTFTFDNFDDLMSDVAIHPAMETGTYYIHHKPIRVAEISSADPNKIRIGTSDRSILKLDIREETKTQRGRTEKIPVINGFSKLYPLIPQNDGNPQLLGQARTFKRDKVPPLDNWLHKQFPFT